MLPIEVVLGTAATIGAIGTTLFGGGLLRQLFTHSNQMAVQKHELAQTRLKVEQNDNSIRKLETDVALHNKDIATFQESLKKLDMLPDINAKLGTVEQLLAYLKERVGEIRRDASDERQKERQHGNQ